MWYKRPSARFDEPSMLLCKPSWNLLLDELWHLSTSWSVVEQICFNAFICTYCSKGDSLSSVGCVNVASKGGKLSLTEDTELTHVDGRDLVGEYSLRLKLSAFLLREPFLYLMLNLYCCKNNDQRLNLPDVSLHCWIYWRAAWSVTVILPLVRTCKNN